MRTSNKNKKYFAVSVECYIFVRILYSTMNNQHQQLINHFETKLNKLIFTYENLEKKNEHLEEELAHTRDELMDAHKEIVDLRSNYSALKMARMVGFSEEDKKIAHRRISGLVRDIDSCLELLNE